MAIVNLKTSYAVKINGLNEVLEGNDTVGSAEAIIVQLFDGSTSVSDTETVKFKSAKRVTGTENAEVEAHASVMFAVASGKTVNRVEFRKIIIVGQPAVAIFSINLTSGDVKTFQNAGTYTINSIKITLREDI